MISGIQLRAARAMTSLSIDQFAKESGVDKKMISWYENETAVPTQRTETKLLRVLEDYDIELTENDGVRRSSGGFQVFTGKKGFLDFLDDVYETVSRRGGEVCVNNVDESLFEKWGGQEGESHKKRMARLTNIRFRVIINENDNTLSASEYASYRWVPRGQFEPIALYIYGRKVASMIFKENEIKIYVIRDEDLASYRRKQFDERWNNANEIV